MNNHSAKRIICQHEETIQAPIGKIFPLACPVEELKWIDGWAFDMIYSDSGVNENNCIFSEEMSFPFLFESPGKTIWHTTLYDKEEAKIHFLLICEEKALIKWEISFEADENGKTRNCIRTTLTFINEEADGIDQKALQQRLRGIITFLGQALKYYCENGKMLKVDITGR